MTNENTNSPEIPQTSETETSKPAPRAKTPLERVREGQAKMRGQQGGGSREGKDGENAASTNSFQRRQFNRKAG